MATAEAAVLDGAAMPSMAMATSGKRLADADPADALPDREMKRKRRSYFVESTEPPRGVPYEPAEHPELALDEDHDHSKLFRTFREPLFPKESSASLAIAYSHRDAAVEERRRARLRKRATLRELRDLREEFHAKKRELLGANAALKASERSAGAWTRKVFDLELKEPCTWNEKLAKLQNYVHEHGKVPEHIKKTTGSEDERTLATFIAGMRSKVKKGHKSMLRFPHRMEALEELGVHWESENDARFEIMFAKLLEYRREHGTLRVPSLDLCKESGDEELIALHNWVFSQVGSFRYQLCSKRVESVRRFLDIGFSFEKWYATNGHVFERDIPPFDAICRRYVENGGNMIESDVEILRAAAAKYPNKKKRKYRQGKEKGAEEFNDGDKASVNPDDEKAANPGLTDGDWMAGGDLRMVKTKEMNTLFDAELRESVAVPMQATQGDATLSAAADDDNDDAANATTAPPGAVAMREADTSLDESPVAAAPEEEAASDVKVEETVNETVGAVALMGAAAAGMANDLAVEGIAPVDEAYAEKANGEEASVAPEHAAQGGGTAVATAAGETTNDTVAEATEV